jgi:predicted Zn-dependent protease
VRMPYLNIRVLILSFVIVLLIAGGVFGWRYYQDRPETLYKSAQEYYKEAEKQNETKDPKAQATYEKARTQIDAFLTRIPPQDPRASQAYLLKYNILKPLASLTDAKGDVESKKLGLYLNEQAFLAGDKAAGLDNNNLEAQAVVLDHHFRLNDFKGAYPYARTLTENLSNLDPKLAERESFQNYIVGAYYVLALRELETDHPDQALDYLAEGQKWEEKRRQTSGPRWRAAYLEVLALQKKLDMAKKQGGSARVGGGANPREVAKKTEQQLNDQMQKYVARASDEMKKTIPPAEGKSEMPQIATLSKTNIDGLIDLLLMSLKTADNAEMVQDRAELLLDVCQKLAGTSGAAPWIYQAAVHGSGVLASVNAQINPEKRIKPEELGKLQERVVAINDSVMKNGGVINPGAYLEMSRTAERENNYPRALKIALDGLKACGDLPPSDRQVLELHAQAAWLLLLDHKVKEADEHLAVIAAQQKYAPHVAYLQGLGAVLDGRLEDGVSKLKEAQKAPQFKDQLPLLLGLAHAYMGMGQSENAVPVLEQLRKKLKDKGKQNKEEEFWANTWLPDQQRATSNLMKAELDLALRSTDPAQIRVHFEKAAECFKELKDSFLAEDAIASLVNYQLTRLRIAEASQANPLVVEGLRKDIDQLLGSVPAASKDDPRILWIQVKADLSQHVQDPATIAGSLLTPLGAPNDMAVRLGELGRLRAGFNWQFVKAEQRILDASKKQKDSMAIQLAWVRWLLGMGRNEEAIANLSELQNKAKDDKERRRLLAFRAQLLLQSGKAGEADKIIKELQGGSGEDINALQLYIDEVLAGGDVARAQEEMKKAAAKYDQSGMYHFQRGKIDMLNGDYAQAIHSFERSLEFTQFKAGSEAGLYQSILGLMSGPAGKPEKANPEAAFNEVKALRKRHQDDPAILLAYAQVARLMDEVYGETGMEGALNKLIDVIKEKQPNNAPAGPLQAAREWLAAGRPDRAREMLKAYPGHIPTLVMATQLAVADEDWVAVADDLKRLKELAPNAVELPLWQGALEEARGDSKEAKKTYEQFIKDHPKLDVGYLAMVRVDEHAGKYDSALEWIGKLRKELPDDTNAAVAHVRILAREGKTDEADKTADAFIQSQMKRLRERMDEEEHKRPTTDKDELDRRAKARAESLNAAELVLTNQLANAFEQAKAYPQAEKWLTDRLMPLVKKMPESKQKDSMLALNLALGSVYMEQGRQLPENAPQRRELMAKAIQLYDEVWQAMPGSLVAGNNLAWLLVKEKREAPRALALVEEVRKGKYSQKPVSAERLPIEFLDTVGVVMRFNGQNQDSLNLFKEAQQRYARDPRVTIHLAQSQKALGMRLDAFNTFKQAIDQADERMKSTPNPDRKQDWQKVIDEAKGGQKELQIIR